MAGKTRKEAPSSSSGGSSSDRGESVVVDYGRRRSSCGYCKSEGRTSVSQGLWAFCLTVDDYQELLDRGWRRSGCFLYKPDMEKTCCPSYTIRLKANDYVPSKEQLRVSKRMQRFVNGEFDLKIQNDSDTSESGPHSCWQENVSVSAVKESLLDKGKKEDQCIQYLTEKVSNAVGAYGRTIEFLNNNQLPKVFVKKVPQAKSKLQIQGSEILLYSCNIAYQIAAALRRIKPTEKDSIIVSLSGHSVEGNGLHLESSPEAIAEKVVGFVGQLEERPDLSIRASSGHINFYVSVKEASLSDNFHLSCVSKGLQTRYGNKRHCLKKSLQHPKGKKRRLEIRLMRSTFDPEEYALYRKYQIKVHNDALNQVSEDSYKRFLVDTPLVYVPYRGDDSIPFCGFGSFHQQYLVDGKLIAVGVIDILPNCLSSKYLFWDPDFAFLSLGKYSVIQEIGWIKENQARCPSLQYYYLGYYIHSCRKMRYKAAYRPSELLCPLRYQWVAYDIVKPFLDMEPYVVLTDCANSHNGESLLPHVHDIVLEQNHDELVHDELKDVPTENDEEMHDHGSGSSDDELDPEPSSVAEVDVGNVLIGLRKSRVRFEDLSQWFSPAQRSYFSSRLGSYVNGVGADLSRRMVYLHPDAINF